MTRTLTTLVTVATLTTVVALGLAATAEAGGCHRRIRHHHGHHHGHHHHRVIHTVARPPVHYVRPAPQWHWYFGLNASLANFDGYRGLRITYVVPGSPAALAGLEAGDIILASNGQNFQWTLSNHQAVTLLRQSVQHGVGGSHSSYGTAQLTVRDLRTGSLISVIAQPYHNAAGGVPTIALR